MYPILYYFSNFFWENKVNNKLTTGNLQVQKTSTAGTGFLVFVMIPTNWLWIGEFTGVFFSLLLTRYMLTSKNIVNPQPCLCHPWLDPAIKSQVQLTFPQSLASDLEAPSRKHFILTPWSEPHQELQSTKGPFLVTIPAANEGLTLSKSNFRIISFFHNENEP